MNDAHDDLGERKRILLARAALQRAQLRVEIEGLRRGFSPPALISSAAGSAGIASMLLAIATKLGGTSRIGRVLRYASLALAVGRMALGFVRRPRG